MMSCEARVRVINDVDTDKFPLIVVSCDKVRVAAAVQLILFQVIVGVVRVQEPVIFKVELLVVVSIVPEV